MLQPVIRQAQGNVRYEDPHDPDVVHEPADVWVDSAELEWLNLPTAADTIWAAYECAGDCTASAIRHRDEIAAQVRATGLFEDVEIQSAN